MDAQDFRSLQEAYMEVIEGREGFRFEYNKKHGRPLITPEISQRASSKETLGGGTYERGPQRLPKSKRKYDRQVLSGVRAASEQEKQRARKRMGIKEDIYDIILSHLLDEGYVNDEKSAFAIMANMSESWKQSILEMDDFAAGGGNAKMKKTGMTRDQVVALGKKNLAAKPASSSSYSKYKSASSSSTSSKPSSPSTSSKPSSTVTARDKFNAHRDARYRADNVASSYGLNRKDPATNAKLKQWADTNYRQNIAIKGNDPNYDPTKTSYPEFTPAKKSAKDAWKNL